MKRNSFARESLCLGGRKYCYPHTGTFASATFNFSYKGNPITRFIHRIRDNFHLKSSYVRTNEKKKYYNRKEVRRKDNLIINARELYGQFTRGWLPRKGNFGFN